MFRHSTRRFTVFLAALAAGSSGAALAQNPNQPFLSPMFTDNMVLQRGISDPVWGWTTPGARVTVSADGKSAAATAGADGEWMAKMPPLPVGGPYTLQVSGPQTVTLNNVLVGDVWVCSGQSNMQFGIGNTNNAAQEIAAADYPQIRLFMAPSVIATSPRPSMPVSDNDPAESHWHVCTPQTVVMGGWNGFTAVGYFFGRDLQQNLHVPIGLIESNWGGTPAEAWTSEEALRAHMPDFQPQLDALDAARADNSPYAQRLAAWYAQNDPGSPANGLGWGDPALDDSAWENITLPGYFQQAGLADLTGINGIVWFRKTFDVPAADAGKDLTLHMLADDNDVTWVNGTQIGATNGFNTPRAYKIPANLLKPTGNVLAVRVTDTGGVGGIYGDPTVLYLEAPGAQNIPLAGPWHVRLGKAMNAAQIATLPQQIDTNQNYPTVLFNGMIRPLIPFAIKGALWYQGESNAGAAYQYRTLLPTMIGDWRSRWNEGNFPFLIVQLAGFTTPPAQPGDDAWAELREAQWMTAQNLPNSGIATAIDIGNPNDIHPKNKQEVGRRLALVAEEKVYHEPVESFGPVYDTMKVQGSTAVVTFRHVGGGLMAQGGGAVTGFAIAGADHKWAWADAKIDGNTVALSSPQVPQPVAVRYAWAAGPIGNLASVDTLPAFPFRTDDWPGVTWPKK